MRCYDGAPDDALKAVLEARDRDDRRLARYNARAIHFPAEGHWAVFRNITEQVTPLHPVRSFVVDCAINIFEKEQQS